MPFQDPAALADSPPIGREALQATMHLVSPDGQVFAGAAAAPVLLRLLPWGHALAWLFAVPGVSIVAQTVYRAIARNRHRMGCGSAVCRRGG